MLLLIDNFDSFTYNLVQSFQIIGSKVVIVRNNNLNVSQCLAMAPSSLVIGPGPGNPSQAGISKNLLLACVNRIPILGVCLGHQCLAEVFGGRVVLAKRPMHGKTSRIYHDNKGIFQSIPHGFSATRYHSLIVERSSLPDCLEISAETEDGEIMGLRHKIFAIESVQFHPESVLTDSGMDILKNFTNFSQGIKPC